MIFTDALEKGMTRYGVPERVIDTLVSRVFIFEDRVIKVYRKEEFFFANLASFVPRKAFYEEDFFWNNNASPEVYLHLWGVVQEGEVFDFVPPNLGEDFAIEMSKIDDEQTLTKLLKRGEITTNHTKDFIASLVDTLAMLTRERRQKLDHLFQRGLYNIMVDNTQSLYDWMVSEKSFDETIAKEIFDTLSKSLEAVPYFKELPIEHLSAAFDNNCDNLILLNGKPSYIDILSPMEVWRVVDEYATVSRTIVDIEVIQSRELGKIARDAYSSYKRDLPKIAMLSHELRAAAIQWPYRYMINQPDLAEKYGEYTKEKLKELKDEIAK